jgi:tetratricopeptide (TPR) repeat protein
MPVGFRRGLISSGLTCLAATDLVAGTRLRRRTERLVLLALLSEYEPLIGMPIESFEGAVLASIARHLLRCVGSMSQLTRLLEEAPRVRNANQALADVLGSTAVAVDASARGDVSRVEYCLARLSRCIDGGSLHREPALLVQLQYRALKARMAHDRGDLDEAISEWMSCIGEARARLDDGHMSVAGKWTLREFVRRRCERVARVLLKEYGRSSSRVRELGRLAVSFDPYDGRAWLLRGDGLVTDNPKTAAMCYEHAARLDYSIESVAILSAGRAWRTCNVKERAVRCFKRALDLNPRDEEAAKALCLVSPRSIKPLRLWARRPSSSRARWIFTAYRPFFDLGPRAAGPIFTHAPEVAFEEWRLGRRLARCGFQRALPPGFRFTLCSQGELKRYLVYDPSDLPEELWTERWAYLVQGVRGFRTADEECRMGIARVLIGLAMYPAVSTLLSDYSLCRRGASPEEAALCYLFAFGRYMMRLGGADHRETINRLVVLHHSAPQRSQARLSAALKLLVLFGRFRQSASLASEWREHARRALEDHLPSVDTFAAGMWTSRFHRAAAYVPFLQGNLRGALLALRYALREGESLHPKNRVEGILARENLYPILESMGKTLELAGQVTAARRYYKRLVQVDPSDSKAWIELGNAHFAVGRFREAATCYGRGAYLGPPGTEIAAYLEGVCWKKLGQRGPAAWSFLDSLRADREGISPHKELLEILRDGTSVSGSEKLGLEQRRGNARKMATA